MLDKKYDHKIVEENKYDFWKDNGFFEAGKDKSKVPFCVVIPPPNVTGKLHLGHAWDTTLQDIMVRYKRMDGYDALWLPGMDHAGIATQAKVDKKLKEQGIKPREMDREEWLKVAWDWKKEYAENIHRQWKTLGLSLDYSRERFTLDEGLSKAVRQVFVDLYNQGLIYRGERIINWDPAAMTALSNEEVIYKDDEGAFYHLKYYLEDKSMYLDVATTRPETLFGDTAVAVNPDDTRYKDLIGKKVILPIVGKLIPIVGDMHADPEFGTGVVKITPAHDPNDFEVGNRHNLERVVVMNPDATMNENAGKYCGLTREECREKLLEDLKKDNLLISIEPMTHSVGHSERSDAVVEPYLSKQWFVKMRPLADRVLENQKNKDTKVNFVPERYEKTMNHWMEITYDWCISRQLWWGHRIPAWYKGDEVYVGMEAPKEDGWQQDSDVLDTWFSSALWPFSTLGWPHNTEELNYYYPTSVLVTGYDIIFFWVVRMAFAGMFCMGETPFKHVLIHGLVRDSEGRKMSKSLGNGIDPLEVIDQYGADALRFMLATGNSPGNDMRFYMERVEAARNFANKLWNASRFVFMNIDEEIMNGVTRESVEANMTLADKWIISRANNVVKEVTDNMDKFDLGIAAQKIYDFAWSEYCDWYIEIVKPRLYSDDTLAKQTALYTLTYVLEKILKLLHPYMPFITEEIYTHLPTVEGSIVIAQFPHYNEADNMAKEEEMMNLTMDGIRNIRNVRAEMNVPPSKKAKVIIVPTAEKKEAMEAGKDYFVTLASASVVEIVDNENNIPEDAVSVVIEGVKIFIPLDELVDFSKELDRLNKEKAKLEGEIKRVNGKLSNQGFLAKAPESLVNEEKAKKAKFEEMMNSVLERIANIEAKIK